MGRLNHKNGKNLDNAYNAYKKTLSINNNFKYAKLGLGKIYKSKGNFREAKKTFQEIIDSNSNEIKAYYEIIDFLDNKEIKKNIENLEILEKNNKKLIVWIDGDHSVRYNNSNCIFIRYFGEKSKKKQSSFGINYN